MEAKIKLLISELGENRIKQNYNADAYYIATNTRELIKSIKLCLELKIPFLIFGMGSKIALAKNGFKGLVIKNRSDNLKIFGIKGKVSRDGIGVEEAFIEADSGTSLPYLNEFALKQGLGGFEDLANAIGTVGGSIMVNQTLREKAAQIKVLAQDGSIKTKELLGLSNSDIILSIIFKLKAKKN